LPSPKLSRRELLKASGAFLGAASLGYLTHKWRGSQNKSEKDFYFFSPYTTEKTNLEFASKEVFITLQSIRSGNNFHFKVPIRGHATLKHPVKSRSYVMLPKRGDKAIEITLDPDMKNLSVKESLCHHTRNYYGHGAFLPHQKILLNSEVFNGSAKGALSVRDFNSYQELSQIDSGGMFPHDVSLLPDSNEILVVNGGFPGTEFASLNRIDLSNNKIVDSEKAQAIDSTFAHIERSRDSSEIFIACTPHQKTLAGQVFYKNGSAAMIALPVSEKISANLHGQALSLSLDEKHHTLGATYPDSNCILFWNYKNRELLRVLASPRPTGLCLSPDGGYFVSANRHGHLAKIDSKTLDFVDNPNVKEASGSYISHASILELS